MIILFGEEFVLLNQMNEAHSQEMQNKLSRYNEVAYENKPSQQN